ncbi:hypothetical protein AB9K41_17330 [Cribrihabitans sp. XS_ASV171]
MFGIVLWSDADDRKAVIWCEDHGDLAYLQRDRKERAVPLEAGDWVTFEVTVSGRMRLAYDVEVMEQGSAPALPVQLAEAAGGTGGRRGAEVVVLRAGALYGSSDEPPEERRDSA